MLKYLVIILKAHCKRIISNCTNSVSIHWFSSVFAYIISSWLNFKKRIDDFEPNPIYLLLKKFLKFILLRLQAMGKGWSFFPCNLSIYFHENGCNSKGMDFIGIHFHSHFKRCLQTIVVRGSIRSVNSLPISSVKSTGYCRALFTSTFQCLLVQNFNGILIEFSYSLFFS